MAAFREVKDLSTDPEYIGYYDIEEARRQQLEDALDTGIDIGREEGMEQGIQQGMEQGILKERKEIVNNLLDFGKSIEEISKITKLDIEEINNILK